MNKSLNIARGGLLIALTVLLIYISSVSPTSKLTILTVASAMIPYSIMITGVKNSFIVYAATSILSFILTASKAEPVAYILLFGLYGFIKYYVESINKVLLEIILKLVYFNATFFILYSLYTELFTSPINIKLSIYVLIAAAQVVFFIYDYAMTVVINYIRRRFIKN
ncbi:hypothetical protein [Clostridium thermarum]|uniref:hypothetical protein n=1 Tax=Clostridium thermarum TaxID=1716543 RepID=UPI00111F6163|nr:hypothetical protein [Clostridium thermarum]